MLNAYRAIWIIQNGSIYTRAKIKKKRYKRKNRKTLNLIDIIEPDKKMRFLQSNFFHFSVRVSIINHGISWIKSVTGFTRANGEKEIKRKKKRKGSGDDSFWTTSEQSNNNGLTMGEINRNRTIASERSSPDSTSPRENQT